MIGHRVGFSVLAFKEYWMYFEGKTNMILGILKIPAIFVGLGLLLHLCTTEVEAGERKWFDGGSVYAGIDYNPNSPSIFCVLQGVNNKYNSNMGVIFNVTRRDHVSLNAKYTHHSCAINPDAPINYDAIGIYASWDF